MVGFTRNSWKTFVTVSYLETIAVLSPAVKRQVKDSMGRCVCGHSHVESMRICSHSDAESLQSARSTIYNCGKLSQWCVLIDSGKKVIEKIYVIVFNLRYLCDF